MDTKNKQAKIYLAGHRGLVGSAIIRLLQKQGYTNIVTRTSAELDLINQSAVNDFFNQEKPQIVYLAAAKVGGIHANNTYPAEFIYNNLMIESNIIHAAYCNSVDRLLFLGSSCIYPRLSNQPMQEQELLSGKLEPTNEPYAIAKIAGIKLCESYNRQYGTDYRSVMPTNLYGPGDNFHPQNSHVLPALIRRFHEAKVNQLAEVEVWGTGKVKREFLYVDDMASACLHVMNLPKKVYQLVTELMLSHLNVGTGVDITIAELAETIKAVVGYKGKLVFNADKPDGAPRKLLDVSKLIQLGWQADIALKDGVTSSYEWYCEHQGSFRI